VAVVDVVRATAEATAAELAAKGVRSLAVVADITRAADCERCAPRTEYSEACRAAAFSFLGLHKPHASRSSWQPAACCAGVHATSAELAACHRYRCVK